MPRLHTALVVFGWSLAAVSLAACEGDDVNSAAPDAGGGDATTTHDSGAVAELCAPYDAAAYSAADISLGKSIVVAEHCQVCHGQAFSGNNDGVNSPGYGTAYPPNLTPDQATGLGCWTDYQIETAFLYGVDNQATLLCPPMPHFGEFDDGGGISTDQAPAVVAFLRSLAPIVNNVPDSPACGFYPPEDGGGSVGEDGGQDAGAPFDGGHHHDGGFGHDGGGQQDGGPDAAPSDDAGSVDASDATTSTADASDADVEAGD